MRNAGETENVDGTGEAGNLKRGDTTKTHTKADNDTTIDAKPKIPGRGVVTVISSTVIESTKGKLTNDVSKSINKVATEVSDGSLFAKAYRLASVE